MKSEFLMTNELGWLAENNAAIRPRDAHPQFGYSDAFWHSTFVIGHSLVIRP